MRWLVLGGIRFLLALVVAGDKGVTVPNVGI